MSSNAPFSPDRRRLLQSSSGLLAAALLAGCLQNSTNQDTTPTPDGDTNDDGNGNGDGNGDDTTDTSDRSNMTQLVQNNTQFGFDLHRELAEANPSDNILTSPYSISIALAMTYAGAAGETAEQMREALRFALTDDDLHPTFGSLQTALNRASDSVDESENENENEDGDDSVEFTLTLANSVWGQTEYPWYDDYLDILESDYDASLRTVDYAADHEGAREAINSWVAEQTNDRIDDLLPQGSLDPLARLVLTNAVYFAANWETPFNDHQTEMQPFTAIDGETTDVPLMAVDDRFPYGEYEGTQLVELPYEGDRASMLLFLPPEESFTAVEESIDAKWLAAARETLDSRDGTVSIPKFSFESGFALKELLSTLGMPIAFEHPAADFSKMADLDAVGEQLFIWDVYHDTFISVDEDGTEAAAATGVVVGTESAPVDPFEFVADRPFLFAICDDETETVLFLGRVVDAATAQAES